MKTDGIALASNLSFVCWWAKVWHPITLKWSKGGGSPYKHSNGLLLCIGFDGSLFMRYVAVRIQCPQKWIGKFSWNLDALATSNNCLCFISTLAFCWGVYGQLVWCVIPCCSKNVVKDELRNSSPLSLQTVLMVLLNWFWTYEWKVLIYEVAWSLLGIKYVQVALEKSSIIVKKYLHLFIVGDL